MQTIDEAREACRLVGKGIEKMVAELNGCFKDGAERLNEVIKE